MSRLYAGRRSRVRTDTELSRSGTWFKVDDDFKR